MTQQEFERHIQKVLITEEEIQAKLQEAGAWIDRTYAGKPLLLVSILNGAFVFMADLCRRVSIPCEIGFMRIKSYSGMSSEGNPLQILMDLEQDISGYHVLLVEDIIDSGRTLKEVTGMLKKRHPLSLRVMTLLDKPGSRTVDFRSDISLFSIDDKFVIGYGLDCDGLYRNLPYIGIYRES